MQAAGGQRQQNVPCLHTAVVNDPLPVHDADRETGKIIVLRRHRAGMLRRFAADQGAARPDAALRHTGDQRCHLFRLVFSDGNIITEKQRPRAAADNIIGHTVDPHGIVAVHELRDALLRADTVRTGNQHRLLHAGKIRRKQAAEAAKIRDHAGNHRARHMALHQLDPFVARFNIHTGCPVALRKATHGPLPPFH